MQSAVSSGLGAGGLTAVDSNPMAFRKLPSIATAATPAQALQTGKKFEAMYLSEMLQPMFAGIKTDKVFGGGHGEEMFQSLAIDEYARAVSGAGGVGIASAVQREILRLQEQAHAPSTTAAAAPAAN
jgi:Rod binding domain-containing protein